MSLRPGAGAAACALVLAFAGGEPALSSSARPRADLASASAPGDPLALTPAMRSWVALELASRAASVHLPGPGTDQERLRELLARLTEEGPERIRERSGPTPTAAEAFATRHADCVGFALLFVTLARAGGIDARFALSPAIESTDEAGTLRIRRSHLAAAFGDGLYDFGGEQAFDPARSFLISDRTARALYFSNRGAQSLTANRVAEAVELLYRAVRFDPSLSWVWTNLGVALRRSGDPSGAILAYEMALRLDAADGSARRNLAVARATSAD